MATVEKIIKPDYRVTLSSDEKEALQVLIGNMSDSDIRKFSSESNLGVIQGIWGELRKH